MRPPTRWAPLGAFLALVLFPLSASAAWQPNGNPICLNSRASMPSLAADGAGGAFIAWLDTRDPAGPRVYLQRLTRSGDPAPGWPLGGLAASPALPGFASPSVVSDGTGGALLAWSVRNADGNWTIGAQRVGPTGFMYSGWPATGGTVGSDGYVGAYSIVADGAGGVFISWQDGSDLVRVQRLQADGAVAASWPAQGVVAIVLQWPYFYRCDWRPAAAPDGQGGVYVAVPTNREFGIGDMYLNLQRITPGGIREWGDGGVAVADSFSNDAGYIRVQGDGFGGALVSWMDFIPYSYPDYAEAIHTRRVTPSGGLVPDWPEHYPGLFNTAHPCANGYQSSPDDSGGIVAVAYDLTLGVLSAQHLSKWGAPAPGWPTGGLLAQPPYSFDPWTDFDFPSAVVPGPQGTIIVLHQCLAPGSDTDVNIHAQLLDPLVPPTRHWPSSTRAICTAPGAQTYPTAVTDGAGGAIVVWIDARSGSPVDLYAQHIDSTGQVGQPGPVGVRPTTQTGLALRAVTPNPGRGPTHIEYQIAVRGPARLDVFDAAGRHVCNLLAREAQPGIGVAEWSGLGSGGGPVPKGMYFVRLESGGRTVSRKLVRIE
ncbi:MAG TPA: T9SS type A sorting domain-containing protein [Candidatus Saccharimonadales bacterium]|nr:T9SS type A sorting domain-containing protein [Candidatus Saccharimonadales bacterium]